MMKVLVTVGTYKFDELIKKIDQIALGRKFEFICQIGQGKYIPKNCESFSFSNNFAEKVNTADLIITHAGAGTVYSLLERKKNLIVVPNTDRVDKHQLEIAKYVSDNKYCLSCFDINDIETFLSRVDTFIEQEKNCYTKEDFFKYSEIIDYLTTCRGIGN
jgi:beta-1,4-N-acetylglucosaminyltransferase